GIKRYRIVGGLCRTCSLKESCLPEKQKHRARFLFRNPLQGEIDSVRRRMPTNTFIKKQIERKWKIEGMFAEAKDRHCLRRAKYRGRSKVQIQLYLTAIVQNLKRMSKSSQYWRNSLNFRCVLWSKSDLDQKAINQVQIFAFIVNLILNLRTRLFFNRPEILSYNPFYGDFTASSVNGITSGPESELVFIFNTNQGSITLTRAHPVVVVDESGFVIAVKAASNIDTNDLLLSDSGHPVKIESIDETSYPGLVVNFHVAEESGTDHFVSANGLIMGDNAWQQRLAAEERRMLRRVDILRELEANTNDQN
ncbi:MAG: transposase, partial [Pseudobacteriovorax sp.]|nr:transposase [Pseudobacteriovorax sp.]